MDPNCDNYNNEDAFPNQNEDPFPSNQDEDPFPNQNEDPFPSNQDEDPFPSNQDDDSFTNQNMQDHYTDTNDNRFTKIGGSNYPRPSSEASPASLVKMQFKVILVGDVAVGKTSILNRFINNNFTENHKCTISADNKIKEFQLDSKTIAKLVIWDTAGEEKFRSVTKGFFRDAHGAIVVFSLTEKSSFNGLEKWLKEIKETAPSNVATLIIGNKSDETDKRAINDVEIQTFVTKNNLDYLEVSAKNGKNVAMAFEQLAEKMKERVNENPEEIKKEVKKKINLKNIEPRTEKKKKKCC